jgi:hypothetical protein
MRLISHVVRIKEHLENIRGITVRMKVVIVTNYNSSKNSDSERELGNRTLTRLDHRVKESLFL